MREEAAIKKCVSKSCRSANNDLYTSYEIQKWLYRRRGYHRASADSGAEARRRRVHRGFVLERRDNPISGLRAYWRPMKDVESSASGRSKNNSSRRVSVFWRKSESVASSESPSRCAVWQCYKRPTTKSTVSGKDAKISNKEKEKKGKEREKEKEKEKGKKKKEKDMRDVEAEEVQNPNNASRKAVRESSIQCQIRRIERPKTTKTLHNSATQTVEENSSNAKKEGEDLDELSDRPTSEEKTLEDLDIREYMKDPEEKETLTEEEKLIAEKVRQMKEEEEKEKERERRRRRKQYVDRGTRFARTISVSKADSEAPEPCDWPRKCPTCGHHMPESDATSSIESSASEDDSRLDAVEQNAKWALQRRAAIQELFLLDNDDLCRQ